MLNFSLFNFQINNEFTFVFNSSSSKLQANNDLFIGLGLEQARPAAAKQSLNSRINAFISLYFVGMTILTATTRLMILLWLLTEAF
ncbi:MAG: hypothetical protein ABI954_12275 [Pyrinomonadaceae bacterium]